MVQRSFHARMKATMVSVLVFTVAPFQLRQNARCTTLESLERSSIQFKRSALIRSESLTEKCSGRVRVGRDSSFSLALHVGLVVRPCAEHLSADSSCILLT